MDPNQGELESPPESEVIPVCERGGFVVHNADKDEDE